MSIKSDFKYILQDAAQKNADAKQRATKICSNQDFTEQGKKNAVSDIQTEMLSYIEKQKAAVNSAVKSKCDGLAAFEDSQLRHKNEDAQYQSLLASTLAILPNITGNVDRDALKARLAPFTDDPIAIDALKNTLAKAAKEKGLDTMAYMDALPKDTRGQKANQLQKLQKTMLEHLDKMQVSVSDEAYQGGDHANGHTISGGSIISATLDYINACSDDDCTVYEYSYLYDDQAESSSPDFAEQFAGQFNHIR